MEQRWQLLKRKNGVFLFSALLPSARLRNDALLRRDVCERRLRAEESVHELFLLPPEFLLLTVSSVCSIPPPSRRSCATAVCIPLRASLSLSRLSLTRVLVLQISLLRTTGDYGFRCDAEAMQFDWSYLKRARDAYISRLNDIYKTNLLNAKIDIFQVLLFAARSS